MDFVLLSMIVLLVVLIIATGFIMFSFSNDDHDSFNHKKLKKINATLLILGNNMATIQEIMAAARAEQDIIVAAVTQTKALVTEVKQLLAANDVAGAQELLDTIAANSAALVAVSLEQADVTAAVDAVNGEPTIIDDVTAAVGRSG